MKERTFYIAGPMRGYPGFNFAAFDEAVGILGDMGHRPISPASHDRTEYPGIDFDGSPDGDLADIERQGFDLQAAVAWDLQQVIESDGVVVLDGWEHSTGAVGEMGVARWLGKPVYRIATDANGQHTLREVEQGDRRFHAVLREMGALHDKKQADYGADGDPFANVRASEEWGVSGWQGCMMRATDKVRRLQTYAKKGTLANEGVEDAFMDLAVYAVIALILFREKKP